MSDDKRPTDATHLLNTVYRKSRELTSGEHGSPAQTRFARAVLLLVVLAFSGGVLWGALLTMPTPLVVLVAAFVVFRVGRWLYRRYFRR
jgi:Flp pilus assembly protein TadB